MPLEALDSNLISLKESIKSDSSLSSTINCSQVESMKRATRVKIYTGPMWSGKTSALLQTVDANRMQNAPTFIVKHSIDTRNSKVHSRTGLSTKADIVCSSLQCSVPVKPDITVAIDEAQFFPDLLPFSKTFLQQENTTLILSGLDLDFLNKPFGQILELAEWLIKSPYGCEVHKLTARCGVCNEPAVFSQRLYSEQLGKGSEAQVIIGSEDMYQPACAKHHVSTPIPYSQWKAQVAGSRT
jgi:thymidine kinase